MNTILHTISAGELASILNISEFTVIKLAKEKQIPCRIIKRRYRFSLKEIIHYLKKLEGGAA